MKQYFENTIRIIRDSLMSIDEAAFEELVYDSMHVLNEGNKVIVSGLGKNVPVCDKFVGTMVSLGLNAYYMNTNSAVHGDIGLVHKGDLVIILTKSGETQESVYLYRLLLKRNCTIWLLTFEEESTLTKAISKTLVVNMEEEGDKWNIIPNNSTTLNLILLQSLAIQIADRMGVSLEQFKNNHPGGHIGELLKDV